MTAPEPPRERGPVSGAILAALGNPAGTGVGAAAADADPFGDDLQLALYVCYELHYRAFAEVDAAWEWDPDLLRVRAELEGAFLRALRESVDADADLETALAPLLVEPLDGAGVSHHLLKDGDLDQFREYVVHRSLYHLKEADPQAWLIPRLDGRAKAGVVSVEFDEYGGGRADRMHARLFGDLMRGLGLDPTYGFYLDRVPAPMLAVVNLMSLFGLHRGRRGMAVGQFAVIEIGSPPGSARLADALSRLGVQDPACAFFYTEHVEADAVHEQLMRREVLGGLLEQEPDLESDVVFGIRASDFVEDRLSTHLLTAWDQGRSSLLPHEPDRHAHART
ncbi:iron-containing redox enzyme family protein [Streptomyces sp. SID3343]|uniref:iron-containing redox enzyme family protein n=1 Tax=Streptomyces sp. SID3343 TaxID=2690260 RepID=UPI0013679F92|nr:iron-containing redox enzyme family protein [Streptomyces sp. SID3343]MYW03801.1 iron-containing redox enzyme family protein [Streptomyces sp. SID3343]